MGRTYETLQVSISAWESVDLFILEAHDGWSGIAGLVPVTHARERPWTSSADGMNNETYPDEEAAEVFAPAVLTFFSFVCPSVYHFGHSARACRSRHSRTARGGYHRLASNDTTLFRKIRGTRTSPWKSPNNILSSIARASSE